jgi:hypothetical protein
MTEARRRQIMYGSLVVALFWGGWNFMHPRKKAVPQQENVTAIPQTAPTSPNMVSQADIAAKQSEPWGRDPFRATSVRSAGSTVSTTLSGQETKPRLTGWSLTGIIDNGSTPLAFINGKMVKVGDLVDQARVVKIEKQKVTLSHNGTEIFLRVNKG